MDGRPWGGSYVSEGGVECESLFLRSVFETQSVHASALAWCEEVGTSLRRG